jgi:hypothetical protein
MEKSNMFETTNKSCDSEGILADHHPFKKKKNTSLVAGHWAPRSHPDKMIRKLRQIKYD